MSEKARVSVFVKLVAILLATGATLLLLVLAFFSVAVNQDYNSAVHRLIKDYASLAATSSPDLAAAQRIRERLGLDIRYEAPDGGGWTTSADLPGAAEARAATGSSLALGPHALVMRSGGYYVVDAPQGGSYVFSWALGRHLNSVHFELLVLLTAFVLLVLAAAWAVLRHLLRPLRTLGVGVARLAEGHLDVMVPVLARDEFGELALAFNDMVRRVRERITARDQLLLDVSHELRSPLTRMKVALELLPDGEQRTRMAADVSEMEAMVTELLELERLRDGRGLRLERVDVSSLVAAAAAELQSRAPGIVVRRHRDELWLSLDEERLRTVLRNLLENAIKYSLPDSAPIELSAGREGDAIVLRVRDDGPGIPAADLPHLFEPFFRVDRSRSKGTGGYGLGLSICKRIVEAHGGRISVENHAGRGATFLLQFSPP